MKLPCPRTTCTRCLRVGFGDGTVLGHLQLPRPLHKKLLAMGGWAGGAARGPRVLGVTAGTRGALPHVAAPRGCSPPALSLPALWAVPQSSLSPPGAGGAATSRCVLRARGCVLAPSKPKQSWASTAAAGLQAQQGWKGQGCGTPAPGRSCSQLCSTQPWEALPARSNTVSWLPASPPVPAGPGRFPGCRRAAEHSHHPAAASPALHPGVCRLPLRTDAGHGEWGSSHHDRG